MKCPNDGSTLTMSERSGIEIDYCPECRGVWLDRGELDKILERSAEHDAPRQAPSAASSYERERDERQQQYQQRYSDPERYARQPPPRKKHKESWLSDILG